MGLKEEINDKLDDIISSVSNIPVMSEAHDYYKRSAIEYISELKGLLPESMDSATKAVDVISELEGIVQSRIADYSNSIIRADKAKNKADLELEYIDKAFAIKKEYEKREDKLKESCKSKVEELEATIKGLNKELEVKRDKIRYLHKKAGKLESKNIDSVLEVFEEIVDKLSDGDRGYYLDIKTGLFKTQRIRVPLKQVVELMSHIAKSEGLI